MSACQSTSDPRASRTPITTDDPLALVEAASLQSPARAAPLLLEAADLELLPAQGDARRTWITPVCASIAVYGAGGDAELVGAWIDFWCEVADSPSGLNCECYVFISFAYDEQQNADTPLAKFCAGRLESFLKGEGLSNLPTLGKVRYQHVPTWFETVLSTLKSQDVRQRFEQRRANVVAAVQSIFNNHQVTEMHMSDLIDSARSLRFDL